jgi:hypothetical protein
MEENPTRTNAVNESRASLKDSFLRCIAFPPYFSRKNFCHRISASFRESSPPIEVLVSGLRTIESQQPVTLLEAISK